jgi:hypothetical protein
LNGRIHGGKQDKNHPWLPAEWTKLLKIENTFHFPDLRATFEEYEQFSEFTIHFIKIQATFPIYQATCRKIFGSELLGGTSGFSVKSRIRTDPG